MWKFNEISEEGIENIINNDISIPKNVINIYSSYILNQWPRDLNIDFTLGNWSRSGNCNGSAKLIKNVDPDKYIYTGYGIGFNSHSELSLPDGSVGKNVIIFGADMS